MIKIVNPKRFIISTLVVIILMGLVGSKLYKMGKSYWGYGDTPISKVATINLSKNKENDGQRKVIAMEDRIVIYNNNDLISYNLEGEEQWRLDQNNTKPVLYGNEKQIFLLDKASGTLSVMDLNGDLLWTEDTGQTVDMFEVNGNSIVMVMEKKANETQILIYDGQGQNLGNINLVNANVMDLAVANSGEILALSVLTTENDIIETNIMLYSLEGKLLGGNRYDDIIGNIFFSGDTEIISVGVDNIAAFHKEKSQLWNQMVSDPINKLSWNGKDLLAINYVNDKRSLLDMGPKSYISFMDVEGNVLSEIPLKDMAKTMDSMDNRLVVAGERTIYLMDRDSEEIIDIKINKDIRQVFFISKNKLAVITEANIDIFALQ